MRTESVSGFQTIHVQQFTISTKEPDFLGTQKDQLREN